MASLGDLHKTHQPSALSHTKGRASEAFSIPHVSEQAHLLARSLAAAKKLFLLGHGNFSDRLEASLRFLPVAPAPTVVVNLLERRADGAEMLELLLAPLAPSAVDDALHSLAAIPGLAPLGELVQKSQNHPLGPLLCVS